MSPGEPCNVLLVLVDSLNRDAIAPYDPAVAHTPNLRRLAQRSVVFDNAFVGSLPCMPARRDIFSGRKELLWRPWGPLELWDARLPRLLADAGYATAIVTDHYHYWEEHGNGYLQCFDSAELIRGQEVDFWKPVPRGPVPGWVERIERWRPGWGRRFYGNVRDLSEPEDFSTPQVMRAGISWLQDHAAEQAPFFLQIELFDVHEPWYVPDAYKARFGGLEGDDRFNIWPPYQYDANTRSFMQQASEAELAHIRSRYAAGVACLDEQVGALLRALEDAGRLDDTVVIVTSDHGHELGERGRFGKSHPHLDSHANIPLLVWHPALGERGGRRCAGLTSSVDLFATILDVAGESPPPGSESRSFLPQVLEPRAAGREYVLYGTFGQGACITDGDWTLIKDPVADGPLYAYSSLVFHSMTVREVEQPEGSGHFIPGVAFPQWKTPVRDAAHACLDASGRAIAPPHGDLLFDRRCDPGQLENRWESDPAARAEMLALLRHSLEAEGAPPEQYRRLGLQA